MQRSTCPHPHTVCTRVHTGTHTQRILEVLGLLVLVGACGFFLAWAFGTCVDLPEDW